MGRLKKYKTAVQLRGAVDAYLQSIRYETPVVVSEPSMEVNKDGSVRWISKALTQNEDGTGARRTVVKYIEPPSVAGLLLFLGISRSTWSEYRQDKALGAAVEYWDMRYEAYLVDRLETGKHISGVIFNLEHNYGWKHRLEQTRVSMSLEEYLQKMEGGDGD